MLRRGATGGAGTTGQGYAGAASYNRGYTNNPIAGGSGGLHGGGGGGGGSVIIASNVYVNEVLPSF